MDDPKQAVLSKWRSFLEENTSMSGVEDLMSHVIIERLSIEYDEKKYSNLIILLLVSVTCSSSSSASIDQPWLRHEYCRLDTPLFSKRS